MKRAPSKATKNEAPSYKLVDMGGDVRNYAIVSRWRDADYVAPIAVGGIGVDQAGDQTNTGTLPPRSWIAVGD